MPQQLQQDANDVVWSSVAQGFNSATLCIRCYGTAVVPDLLKRDNVGAWIAAGMVSAFSRRGCLCRSRFVSAGAHGVLSVPLAQF